MNLAEVRDILNATAITGQTSLQHPVESAYCADLMSDVLSFSVAKCLLITGLTNAQVIRTAEMAAIAMIVFVQGKRPAAETIRLAEEKNIRTLAQRRAETGCEIRRVLMDFPLREKRAVVFKDKLDGILERHDVAGEVMVHPVQTGRAGGRFPRAGGTGDEDQPVAALEP